MNSRGSFRTIICAFEIKHVQLAQLGKSLAAAVHVHS